MILSVNSCASLQNDSKYYKCDSNALVSFISENFEQLADVKLTCSGFINYVLKIFCKESYEEITQFVIAKHQGNLNEDRYSQTPTSLDYIAFMLDKNNKFYWERVEELCDVKPGDIIIYCPFEKKERTRCAKKKHHMMIVKKSEKIIDGYKLQVIHSTSQWFQNSSERLKKIDTVDETYEQYLSSKKIIQSEILLKNSKRIFSYDETLQTTVYDQIKLNPNKSFLPRAMFFLRIKAHNKT